MQEVLVALSTGHLLRLRFRSGGRSYGIPTLRDYLHAGDNAAPVTGGISTMLQDITTLRVVVIAARYGHSLAFVRRNVRLKSSKTMRGVNLTKINR